MGSGVATIVLPVGQGRLPGRLGGSRRACCKALAAGPWGGGVLLGRMTERRRLFGLTSLHAGSAVLCAFIVPDGLSRVLSPPQ